MLVTSLASLAQKWLIIRAEGSGDAKTLVPQVALAALMLVALLIATLLPSIGLWSLLLLVASRPVEVVLSRVIRPHVAAKG